MPEVPGHLGGWSDAVVGRENAGWTMSKSALNGIPQKRLEEDITLVFMSMD